MYRMKMLFSLLNVKEKYRYLQVETFQNSNAAYLVDPSGNFNYLNFLPKNSRRFRTLPVWFTLRAYGKVGCQEIVQRNIILAKKFGAFILKKEESGGRSTNYELTDN